MQVQEGNLGKLSVTVAVSIVITLREQSTWREKKCLSNVGFTNNNHDHMRPSVGVPVSPRKLTELLSMFLSPSGHSTDCTVQYCDTVTSSVDNPFSTGVHFCLPSRLKPFTVILLCSDPELEGLRVPFQLPARGPFAPESIGERTGPVVANSPRQLATLLRAPPPKKKIVINDVLRRVPNGLFLCKFIYLWVILWISACVRGSHYKEEVHPKLA